MFIVKKGLMIGVLSLLLGMAFISGAVVGEEVEKPEGVTEATAAQVEISVELTADISTASDTALSSEIAPSGRLALLSEPSFLVDESQDEYSSAVIKVCSLTCDPCATSDQCPLVGGRHQKCVQACF